MLSMLHIENIAVIECTDIVFHEGFNILTGETGAGKSIVIDGISAILGERAYRDMVRTGTQKATVRAVFTDVPQFSWFEENAVEYDPETVIHREIYLDGKNICRVNGSPVNVSALRKLGLQLINIHGQHDSASLFDEANHLRLLDEYAGNERIREDYRQKFDLLAEIRGQIRQMSMDESEKLRRMEMLRYQIAEITKADVKVGEDEELEKQRRLLQNAEKINLGINRASEALYGNEETDGAVALLQQAEQELGRLQRVTDAYDELQARVKDLMYQVQDAAEELRDATDNLTDAAEELERVESRLDVIHRLRKKYGATCADILQYLSQAQEQLDDIAFADDRLHRLETQCAQAEREAMASADRLRESRKKAAEGLTEKVLSELAQLDMPKVQFQCLFTEIDLCSDGADQVAFYMSANAGEALKPLSRVASGGELARIMLALKNVLAEQDRVQTLIFDEVDTGVSGRAAQKVAEKLRAVAKNKQVLCVTHLPQLAALGQTHLLIAKQERDGRTYTTVTPLDMEGRKWELARIIGGANITETTLKSAEEMLNNGT